MKLKRLHRLNHRTSEHRLRAAIERPQIVRHWGADYTITPLLIDEVFGDGKRLIRLGPLNTRPNYYVIRIDSRYRDLNGDRFRDLLYYEIYQAIEDQFGRAVYERDEDDSDEWDERYPWPALDDEYGSCWGELDWPWSERSRRLMERERHDAETCKQCGTEKTQGTLF